MKPLKSTKLYIPALYFILIGLEGLSLLAWLTFFRSDYGSLGAWKTNRTTLIISTVWLLLSLEITKIGILVLFQKPVNKIISSIHKFLLNEKKGIRWVLILLFILYLILTTDRIVRLDLDPVLQYYFLEPFSIWFYLFIIQSLILILWKPTPGLLHKKTLMITLVIIAMIWLSVVITDIGLTPDSYYWNVAGVPILFNQFILILLIVLLAEYFLDWIQEHNYGKIPEVWIDIVICFGLVVGAAWLWKQAPFSNSYFAKGPFPPNRDFYPYSDAALTDLGGQYMLIGERLEYPDFTEKPLYTLFLGLLHQFFGQGYIRTTDYQILFFAILPTLLFLLGKIISSRLFGLALALYATVKEYNAITATYYISVSNSRLYLSEFPTLIFMVLFAITLSMWFKRPRKINLWIILSGAVLGFALMIRTNALVLLPCILIAILYVYKPHWKQILPTIGIFLLGFFLALVPWITYNQVKYGTDPFSYKIQSVIQTRFLHVGQDPAPTGLPGKDTQLFSSKVSQERGIDLKVIPALGAERDTESQLNYPQIVVSHFLNNEIKALFVLPFQLYPLDLPLVLHLPYWDEPVTWRGEMPLSTGLAFAANLTLIGLGISAAWQKNRLAGLIPLLINVGYYLSNALGRTSGSRYLLPADWTLYFYFLLGLAALWRGLKLNTSPIMQAEPNLVAEESASQHEWRGVLIAGLVILVSANLIPLINISYPKLYAEQNEQKTLAALYQSSIFTQQPELIDQVSDLIEQENGMVFTGRMLYPRYRDFAQLEDIGLFLTVLQPDLTEVFFHFDEDDLTEMLPGQDVIIVGCKKEGYVEGFLGYLPEQGLTFRSNIPYSPDFCQR